MSEIAASAGEAYAPDRRSGLPSPLLAVLPLLFATIAINPVGYLGGGADDWHYLEAARCAAAHGFCLPHDHWWTRFPLVAPMGAAIALLGESRAVLSIVPLAYGLAAAALFVALLERQFGRLPALIGGLALVATPNVSMALLQPNIDIVELCFVVAALFCLQSALGADRRRWAIAAGVMLALAIQSRASALALAPIAALLFLLLPRRARRLAPGFALGLAAPLAVECLAYWAVAGDPLHSWKLSLGHTRIPSTELAAGVDLGRSPLFNIEFIDGWRPAMGIDLHWSVDPFLNLLVHPSIGLTLLAALALMLVHRRALGRAPLWLLGASILYFGALAYALAIDPKPRMFLPLSAAAAAIIGILGARGDRLPVAIFIAASTAMSIYAASNSVDPKPVEARASAWIAAERAPLAIERTSARLLTLAPAARALPVHPVQGIDRVLAVAVGRCADIGARLGAGGWRLVRSQAFDRASLCLFSRSPA